MIVFQTSVSAQSSLTIDASQMMTSFKFIDSEGNQDKTYNSILAGSYSVGYRYKSESGFLVRAAVGMRNAGATMVYEDINYLWDFQYADIKLGAGYMINMGRFSPYMSASPYFAYLLKANQTINNVNYDLVDAKQMQSFDYGVNITPGLQLNLSNYISAYTEFNYLMGLNNIESHSTTNLEAGTSESKGYNKSLMLTLGIAFTITSNK